MTQEKALLSVERDERFVTDFLNKLEVGIPAYINALEEGLNKYRESDPENTDRITTFDLMVRPTLKTARLIGDRLVLLRLPEHSKKIQNVSNYTLTTVRQMSGPLDDINRLWRNDPYRWIDVVLARLTSIVYQVMAWTINEKVAPWAMYQGFERPAIDTTTKHYFTKSEN